jgi:hypothetical protein
VFIELNNNSPKICLISLKHLNLLDRDKNPRVKNQLLALLENQEKVIQVAKEYGRQSIVEDVKTRHRT